MHTETTKSFIIGFLLSVALTFAAYYAVVNHLLTGTMLLAAIIILAFVLDISWKNKQSINNISYTTD